MARYARVVIPKLPHHITQQGNRAGPVFFSIPDREHYLSLFQRYARKSGLEIGAYCLMDNHVHFIAVPQREDALARTIGYVHMRHAQLVNRNNGWTGHLWSNRFHSTPLDWDHFRTAVRYVELNPVRAGMIDRAEEYKWSSAQAHVFGAVDPLLTSGALFGLDDEVGDWSQWLNSTDDFEKIDYLRDCTKTGRPCGSEAFLTIVSNKTGRALRRKPRGRKPREVP